MEITSTIPAGSPIDSMWAASGSEQKKTSGAAEEMGKDDFLMLLVAQLKHQDPIDPVKNEAFIAQLATFSSLEQLIAIKDGVNRLVGDQPATDGNNPDNSSIPEDKG